MDASNINKISFDFDGVFMAHFLNRHWIKASNIKEEGAYKKSSVQKVIDAFLNGFFFSIRPEIKGAKNVIPLIKDKKLYINTSRRNTVAGLTTHWLQRRDLYKYFETIFFNEHNLVPYLFKEKTIQENSIDLHIDDDYETLQELAKRLPSKQFIYFNSMHTNEINLPNVVTVTNWDSLGDYLKSIGIIQ